MNDTLDPIIVHIKEGRQLGLDDIEIEQQLLLGNWSESELQLGQNFLHLTQKLPVTERPEALVVLSKEKLIRKHKAQLRFMLNWLLPVGATIVLSVLVGLSFNNFSYLMIGKVATTSPATQTKTAPYNQATQSNQTNQATQANQNPASNIVCGVDKKICADGTVLSRTPPACVFAQCPQ